jgi:hypothetical protein
LGEINDKKGELSKFHDGWVNPNPSGAKASLGKGEENSFGDLGCMGLQQDTSKPAKVYSKGGNFC